MYKDKEKRKITNKKCNKSWYINNPEKVRAKIIKRTLGSIKFTLQDYDAMFKLQKGLCAICKLKSNKNLCVDHCHKKLKVRGLLCPQCNLAVGNFKDNIKNLKSAIKYLKQ